MTNETVIEELQAQRNFLLENKWVGRIPEHVGEGCLMLRQLEGFQRLCLSHQACDYVGRIIHDSLGQWNDERCQSAGEAIAVLDEAIILAKRDLS